MKTYNDSFACEFFTPPEKRVFDSMVLLFETDCVIITINK